MKISPNTTIIETIKQNLINVYHPLAIYLFGSYVWGAPDTESDIDLMIVVEKSNEKLYKRPVAGHRSMRGIPYPTDLLVYTKEEFEKRSNDRTTLCYKIKNEGKVIYGKL